MGVPGALLSYQDGLLLVKATGTDPYIVVRDLQLDRGPYVLTFRMKSSARGPGRVSWSPAPGVDFTAERSAAFTIEHDDQWHEYQVALPANTRIGVLRIDPGDGPGTIAFEWLHVRRDEAASPVREWTFAGGKP